LNLYKLTVMKHNKKKLAAMATAAALIIGFGARAQSVQEGSVWAPAGIKVDAKLDEWGNTLQANNKTTNLYYTIANDDRFLYLAIKSTDQANNNKITGGGITFSVNTDGRKKDKDAFQVIFPVVNRENMRAQFRRGGGGGPGGQPNQMPDSAAIANMRASLLASVKEITLRGFKNIPDSVISIYNEYSIKAAVGYDKNGSFVYELALPLEQLGVKPGSTKELAYNVKVNGIQFRRNNNDGEGRGDGGGNGGGGGGFGGGGGRGNGGGFGGGGGGRGFGGGGRGGFGGGMNFQDMLNPTDFWGKYTLAKNSSSPIN
jgi:hypothetical protein